MVNINVFSQILGLVDRNIFNKLVQQYQSDNHFARTRCSSSKCSRWNLYYFIDH
ncbi:DUF4372 domain-containing protein [Sphingobacterium litopenaei]|uniref:DUF4372 domain-containing protein n=1 Tax=Sphingobacterium litopenaei TaxID=2763500 RepID=A0ABR7Y9L6_9SPHI|nr:DUF4372 domain-containing protein [Sphingobacterium litopenaei]